MRNVQYILATVLLLIAVIDLLVPGLCLVEPGNLTNLVQQASSEVRLADESDDDRFHDDCYCCCAHVLPRQLIRLQSAADDVPCSGPEAPSAQPIFASSIYHPPIA
jgi:hypothetical protein